MSAFGQEVLRLAGIHELEQGEKQQEIKKLQRCLKGIVPRGKGRLPSAAQVAAHRAHFSEDLERLKGVWLPATSKFFEDGDPYPDAPTEVSVRDDELQDYIAQAKMLREKLRRAKIEEISNSTLTPGTLKWRKAEAISRGTLGEMF